MDADGNGRLTENVLQNAAEILIVRADSCEGRAMFGLRFYGMLLVCAFAVAVVPGCTKPDPVESSESSSSAKSGSAAKQKPLSVLSVQRDLLGEGEDQVDGETVTQYILQNRNGMTVSVLDYGALITSIRTPDRKGKIGEVTLGFKKLAVLSVTTFWTFRREFSPLGVRAGKTWYHLKSGAIPINTRAAQKSLDQHSSTKVAGPAQPV